MQTHAIVELEEGSLTVTVGGFDGHATTIVKSVRLPVADLGRDSLTNALRGLGSDVLQGARGVHVVLGERRMQHFLSTVPLMAAGEVTSFVVREALRVTSMQSSNDVLVAPRLLRRLPGQKLVVGSTALARSVWEPMRAAFSQNSLEVLSLHSMEACLALAATPDQGDSTAVLECNAGRARFVLCDRQCPVQVRRFLIGSGADANAAAFTAQLAMELPRTLDWLRETGHALPSALVLGTRVNVEDGSFELLRGDFERIVAARVSFVVGEHDLRPSLGVAMLLERLGNGTMPPSLLSPPRLKLPWSRGRFVALAAVATAGLLCSWSAIVDGSAMLSTHDEVAIAAAENLRLQQEVTKASVVGGSLEDDPNEARLVGALTLRRPVSRLLGEVSNLASDLLHLDEMKFASTERIVITGFVQGESRPEAFAAIAAFARKLRGLPYLSADGQEEINEVVEHANRFRFRLSMTWRNS